MTIEETIRSATVGDVLCGVKVSRSDREALDRLLHVLTICATFDQVDILLGYNTRAREWFQRIKIHTS